MAVFGQPAIASANNYCATSYSVGIETKTRRIEQTGQDKEKWDDVIDVIEFSQLVNAKSLHF